MTDKTFINQCLDGEAVPADIDDFIDCWHDGESLLELHEYLGLSFDEYAAWIEHPDSLNIILLAKKYGVPLKEALAVFSVREQQFG